MPTFIAALASAFFNPVRKVYYNLAITGLSVAICIIGRIETLAPTGPRPPSWCALTLPGPGAWNLTSAKLVRISVAATDCVECLAEVIW